MVYIVKSSRDIHILPDWLATLIWVSQQISL